MTEYERAVFHLFYNRGPSVMWALKPKQTMEKRLVLLKKIFGETWEAKQTEIMMYLCKVVLSVPALLPAPPPLRQQEPPLHPQPTTCEDSENEDLYDDPLPLND